MNDKFKLAILFLFFISFDCNSEAYETYPIINSNSILGPDELSSTYHRVESVEIDDGLYQFVIESDIGLYNISSLPLFKKRISEIKILAQAIEQYELQNNEISEELRSQLSVSGDSAVAIITDPIRTASRLANQVTDNLNATFSGEDPYVTTNNYRYISNEPKDPTTAIHKRNAAFQLGLDVYSSNYKVQSFLNTIAHARSSGKIAAGVGFNTGFNNQTGKTELDLEIAYTIKNKTLDELKNHNSKMILSKGVSQKLAREFIVHPVLTPSCKTTIVTYLSKLKSVSRIDSFIKLALTAKNEASSLKYQQLSKMLLTYYKNIEEFTSIYNYKDQVAILTTSRQLILFDYVDLLIWSEDTQKQYGMAAEHAKNSGYKGLGLVSNGALSTLTDIKLSELGYIIHTNFL